MNNRQFLLSLLAAGMSFGTAWAIRGQFGHEQGAAWAGGIGALGIILLSKRPDWYAKAFHLALAAAAGWGITGIISYGLVVGYGRGVEFSNVYYGFLMLFIIGSLFGLLGGGLFGLVLADRPEKPVQWSRLIVEMAIGSMIFYYLLVNELGWLMTPPRSEAWAACFGMVVAMYWYMIREKQYAALRVSIFAALGGGFGFAFGNFLQVLGNTSGIKFNFWNVMEYSIGFFSGIGLAYGTFTSHWEPTETTVKRTRLLAPLIILTLIIPFIVWDQSFKADRLSDTFKAFSSDPEGTTLNVQWVALLSVLATGFFWLYFFYWRRKEANISLSYKDIFTFLLGNLGLYTLFSLYVTGAFMSLYRIEQYLYIVNLAVIAYLFPKCSLDFSDRGLRIGKWAVNLLFLCVFIALLAVVAISIHGEVPHMQRRFE